MIRKTFGKRRSSQPKRPSIPVENGETPLEKNSGVLGAFNQNNARKTKIPRPSRAVSAERESRSGERRARSQSSECKRRALSLGNRLKALSTENLAQTPASSIRTVSETPASSAAKFLCSSKKVPKKDSRPLQDKQYQNQELQKVRAYLINNNLGAAADELAGKNVTQKTFVTIMSRLLGRLYPKPSITMSNYTELLPLLMKEVKYPGNAQRSVMVSAGAAFSWPIVLGMMSWLVNRLSVNLSWKEMPDEHFSTEEFMEIFNWNCKSYCRWVNDPDTSLSHCEEDEKQFVEKLVNDRKESIKQIIQKNSEENDKILKQLNNPEDIAADENLKTEKAKLEMTTAEQGDVRNRLHTLQAINDKLMNEKATLEENLSRMTLEKQHRAQKIETFSDKTWSNEDTTRTEEECVYVESVIYSLKNEAEKLKKTDYVKELQLSNVMRQVVSGQQEIRALLETFPDICGLAGQAMQLPATDKRRLSLEQLEQHLQLVEQSVDHIRQAELALHPSDQAALLAKTEKEQSSVQHQMGILLDATQRLQQRSSKVLTKLQTQVADGQKLLNPLEIKNEAVQEGKGEGETVRVLEMRETFKQLQQQMEDQEKELKNEIMNLLKEFYDHLNERVKIKNKYKWQ